MDPKAEEKVVEYYKKTIREIPADEQSITKAYQHIKKHKTAGNTTRLFLVDWEGFFNSNKCPVCEKTITLKNQQYACDECGFNIDLASYEDAKKQYEKKIEKDQKAAEKQKEFLALGFTQKKLDELYEKTLKEVYAEEEEDEQQ